MGGGVPQKEGSPGISEGMAGLLCERLKEGLTGGAGLSAETAVERGASAVRPQAGLGRGWAGRGRAGGKRLLALWAAARN